MLGYNLFSQYVFVGLNHFLIHLVQDHCKPVSDLPGPAQSHEPGQAKPVLARPSQAIGDGPAMALAQLRVAESQSQRLKLWNLRHCFATL